MMSCLPVKYLRQYTHLIVTSTSDKGQKLEFSRVFLPIYINQFQSNNRFFMNYNNEWQKINDCTYTFVDSFMFA